MYEKHFYGFRDQTPVPVTIRNYGPADFEELIGIQQESFPPPFPSELWWNEEQLGNHVRLFPEGALCAVVDGRIVGSMTSLLVDFDEQHADHTWEEITDGGYITNHNPNGNTLYVVDICVSPAYRKLGLGHWLMQSMYEVVVAKGLDRLLGGGRMPGYRSRCEQIGAEGYLDAVLRGEIADPVLTFLLRCGRTPVKVLRGYLEDRESCNYAALMEWRNPFRAHNPT
jgi:ribosomal protein S18 acetylase RimI-like enzyme